MVVAILLVAMVLAGIITSVALSARRMDSERTVATQALLKEGFRWIFPYGVGHPSVRALSDLRKDFGYNPAPPTTFLRSGDGTRSWNLALLVDRSRVGDSDRAFSSAPPPVFDGTNAGGAWNGPYWRGPVDGANRPTDAWGHFLELRYVTSPNLGWILHSPGANGVDDTGADSGVPIGDDLIYPNPPYLPASPFSTFGVTLNLSFVLNNPGTCSPAENINLTVVLEYEDGSGLQSLTVLNAYQMHRRGSGGKPQRADVLNYPISLRSNPSGSPGLLRIRVTDGCPDTGLAASDFNPSASSQLAYLGASTSGPTTTYTFLVNYAAQGVVPWPITLRP